MAATGIIKTTFPFNGPCQLTARITASDGTGGPTGVANEGNWAKQADITSIAYEVYNTTNDPDMASAIASASFVVATAISDTPITASALWPHGLPGYNFTGPLPDDTFATRCDMYRVRVIITFSGGASIQREWEGTAE